MRHTLNARDLVTRAARDLALDPAAIDLIFQDTPVDFRVILTPQLPFQAHRLGMSGITLLGTVYLLEAALRLAPEDLIVLLRHEAEHVRQQRGNPLFYPRYLFEWMRELVREGFRGRTSPERIRRSRWHTAYRAIQAEREAYGAGERARRLLLEHLKRK